MKMNYLLPHSIERSAERFPEQDAFRCGNNYISYKDLSQRTNQLAHLLVELGVKKGDRVGIYLRRSLESAIAVYGIMKAGAAYVPLDPDAPESRIRFLLQDCGIQHLITAHSPIKTLKEVITEGVKLQSVIGIDDELPVTTISWHEVAQLPADHGPRVRILEQDLAYIMYTSGSTGVPKGIMHSHYSGLSYARLSAQLYGLDASDRIGNHAALHFDISTLGYFSSPFVGATTVIIPEAHTKMPASMTQLMEQEKLTVWYSVPLALVQLLSHGLPDQRDLSTIRWVLFGGEPFPSGHLKKLMAHWPQAKFSNVYGPAEVNQCTYYHLPAPPETGVSIPIGRVWDNTEILIVDQDNTPVAAGEPGELLVRSATMMKGYWKQPSLTEKSLYVSRDQGFEKVYYKTGDLVRRNAEGELMFLGREDRQIKTRGYRVELDEIEAVILGHEAVMEAAAFGVSNASEGLLIEATVILKEGETLEEADLFNYLGLYLPLYAMPRKINFVLSLPYTTTGKIDRTKLRETAENFKEKEF